jgi:hypothetical protein
MPSAAYFRRQADICLRLSLVTSDDATSARLVTMAKEYLATSEALDKQPETGPSDLADPETTTREDIPDFAGEARRPTAES